MERNPAFSIFQLDGLGSSATDDERSDTWSARPYRKNEQSYIESFNRTVRKECLGWQNYRLKDLPECQKMVELFLERYHYHQPHMGLSMRTSLRKEDECRISTEN